MEEAKSEKKNRKKNGDVAVEGSAEGTQNVAAVELRDGQEIERSGEETNPGGASGKARRSNKRSGGTRSSRLTEVSAPQKRAGKMRRRT